MRGHGADGVVGAAIMLGATLCEVRKPNLWVSGTLSSKLTMKQ